ncbi:unnamed protein product [Hymenolepis diminuta]|uniref:Collagenase NC10/endostatin domain-containing protein n=1 Tax=Hymenolepis diminuta TaxID=6216 RepID=A0A3P7BMD8_HYMDI|nr:unnamed protein product [Hymenolepis diminuta]
MVPLNGLKRPFRREGSSVVKPFRNFATGLVDKDKLWLLLPWIFMGAYPYKLQGGELHGFAMAEMACRESGEAFFGDGGFRALLTSHHRPLDKIMPRHLSNLPLVNLHGDLLAKDWQDFLYGRLANNTLISMDGSKEEISPRWNWKYYWLGDGYRRTCTSWTSSYLMDVANVIALDYENQEVVHDIASCSSNLHLLCYSVCEDYDQFL